MSDASLGLIRHILTFAGGWMVSRGYVDADTMTQVVGAGATLIGAAWSLMSKQDK